MAVSGSIDQARLVALAGRVGVVVKEDQCQIGAKLAHLCYEALAALMRARRDHL